MCFRAIRGSFPLFCSKAALVVISSVCNEFHDHSFFVVSLKYKFIYFNWRLTALQYCVGFAIPQHESATGISVLLSDFWKESFFFFSLNENISLPQFFF